MKTSFWSIAAATLLLAGCSKEELTENISDGASVVATPTNGSARLGRPGNQPTVKFKNDRIIIRLNDTKTEEEIPLDALLEENLGQVVLTNNETTPPTVLEFPLTKNSENENQRYRTPQFELSEEMKNELFNIEIQDAEGTYLWGASIFVREDGKAVENNPVIARTGLVGRWSFDDATTQNNPTGKLAIIVGDDPTQQVANVEFLQAPVFENPDDSTTIVTEYERATLQQTHFNPAIGYSRWKSEGWNATAPADMSGVIYLKGATNYDVDFLASETNVRVIGKYNLTVNEDGETIQTLSDEPEILGARITSTTFGETWKMEFAFADLGDWVESVNYVIDGLDGSDVEKFEIPLKLEKANGNLRVYSYSGVIYPLIPDGGDLTGTVVFSNRTGRRVEILKAEYRATKLADEEG
ncbi:MAG: hypothetical protein ACPGU4_07200 [Flavobacteriales bacterium]